MAEITGCCLSTVIFPADLPRF